MKSAGNKIPFVFVIFLSALSLAAAFSYGLSPRRSLFIKPLFRIQTDQKLVALTFDDGPSAARTPALLDLLDRYNVKATFFMLGERIEEYPEIARQVFLRGHVIGSHSYSHVKLYLKPPRFVKEQLERTDALIRQAGQEEVGLFRPPYSVKFITLPLLLCLMHKQLVAGTYDPSLQYLFPYNGRLVAEQVVENIQPGAIIYLHDGREDNAKEFLMSVEMMIARLKEKGYRFVSLDNKGRE
ncbi:MAG: polysaccharide deacetylase family protein [Candidatus Pacebacteria bacterium]|nr:polysaccharide deacetylase family protein [Candidatus Paceibacterota bacterium]